VESNLHMSMRRRDKQEHAQPARAHATNLAVVAVGSDGEVRVLLGHRDVVLPSVNLRGTTNAGPRAEGAGEVEVALPPPCLPKSRLQSFRQLPPPSTPRTHTFVGTGRAAALFAGMVMRSMSSVRKGVGALDARPTARAAKKPARLFISTLT
jgi:hypothetical protein